ncbi:MAG: hypothetical protein HN936_18470 [Bacteroidetes bacterium]|jgi:hypothetical protein|nr:hypothetical protein [Bacteroidota bacterium]MBT4410892.1 hypothetical protein [Bacteroidota bacterium]MBT7095236.1 hypothetical protein [Bacteroidota bacterium]MBT7463365.1 hypothetical protein [Bacteroidota bacterium]
MMQPNGSNSGKLLEEGQSYRFNIKKLIDIPGSGEKHFILVGPDKKKYLLNSSYYDHYPLRVGMTINCQVDKINCTGRIFIEPEHPYYALGDRYDFLLIKITEEKNIWNEPSYTAWVRDLHRKEWACPIDKPDLFQPGMSYLSCRVERIKKAQLLLSLPSIRGVQVRLRHNTVYDFTLREVREFHNTLYYVLEDPYGSYHILEKRFYEHFNYSKGQFIQARIIDMKPDGTYLLEPLNPYYRIGEVYMFKFMRLEQVVAGDFEGRKATIWVKDYFSQAIKLAAKDWQINKQDSNPKHIPCKVIKFKKGSVVLENLAEPEIDDLDDYE